ncbi:MAG: ABC transporter substrate-binding protein [Acetobacteraceae bacterium]|nr:ABC transporter substrate-binding protein [Acetobacteraceae bacterium]
MPALLRRRALLPGALALPALARAQAPAEWRVGCVFPLGSLLGDEAMRGVELAAEERNAQGGIAGRPLRLIRADAADAAQGLTEARRLLQGERCALLLGAVTAPLALAAAQAADAAETPFVELAVTAESLTDRGFRHLIRSGSRAADFGTMTAAALLRLVAPELAQPADALRCAILHEASPSPESIAEGQDARLREAGIVVAERVAYAPRSPEIPALVQRLRAAGVAVLLHAGGEADIAALLRAMQDAAWRPRVVIGSGSAWGLDDLARAAGPALEGCLVLDAPPLASADAFAPGARAFAEAYQRRWGSLPRAGLSFSAYAGARQAFAAPTLDRAAFRTALNALDLPAGGLPNGWGWRLDDRGQNQRAQPVLAQWQGGRPATVFPAEAAVARVAL